MDKGKQAYWTGSLRLPGFQDLPVRLWVKAKHIPIGRRAVPEDEGPREKPRKVPEREGVSFPVGGDRVAVSRDSVLKTIDADLYVKRGADEIDKRIVIDTFHPLDAFDPSDVEAAYWIEPDIQDNLPILVKEYVLAVGVLAWHELLGLGRWFTRTQEQATIVILADRQSIIQDSPLLVGLSLYTDEETLPAELMRAPKNIGVSKPEVDRRFETIRSFVKQSIGDAGQAELQRKRLLRMIKRRLPRSS